MEEYIEVLDFITHNQLIMDYIKDKLDLSYHIGTEYIIDTAMMMDDLETLMNRYSCDGDKKKANRTVNDNVLEILVRDALNEYELYLERLDAERLAQK